MNKIRPGRLAEPATLAQIDESFWVIPCRINGRDLNQREAVEAAQRTGRRYSAHGEMLEAAAALRIMRA
jgi:hypothetical protein